MTRIKIIAIAAAIASSCASSAFAQSDITSRTAVSFSGGLGSTTATTGIAVGASILFDANDRLSFEGQGTYLDRGAGADALSVSGGVLVNLLPSPRQWVPYAAAGGGVYRSWFNLDNPRFTRQPDLPIGPMRYHGLMSDFYARRLDVMTPAANGIWGTRRFTDPALSLGGGVRINVSEHLMVRPDLRALTVFADGEAHTMAVFGLHLAYRF